MSRRMISISMIFYRLLASLVVIRSSCCGWSACRRVCRAAFAPSINCLWRTRRRIGARCQVWRTWTLLAEDASPFPRARCSRRRRKNSCRHFVDATLQLLSIRRDVDMLMRRFFIYGLSRRILLFSARYDNYYLVWAFSSSYF